MAREEQRGSTPNEKSSPRKPHRVSKRGWKEMLAHVKRSISKDHISIIAAGVAFYLLLGVVPAIAAAISVYGLVADPHAIQEHFKAMEGVMPQEANQLLLNQMERLVNERGTAGWGALIGIALALWGASRGTKATMEALNITYDEEETRSFIKLIAVALALTLAVVLLGVLAVALVVFLPALLEHLPLPEIAKTATQILMWPLLLAIGIFGITLMYRYGPDRRQPEWKWLTWGSASAAILWLIASALFSLYVAKFGNFNETYGTLGAIVILLLWFWVTAFVVLFGAELDAAMERQTEKEVLPE